MIQNDRNSIFLQEYYKIIQLNIFMDLTDTILIKITYWSMLHKSILHDYKFKLLMIVQTYIFVQLLYLTK